VTKDPESSDLSSSLSSQHIFQILKSREEIFKMKYSAVICIKRDLNMLLSMYTFEQSDLSVKLCISKRYILHFCWLRGTKGR